MMKYKVNKLRSKHFRKIGTLCLSFRVSGSVLLLVFTVNLKRQEEYENAQEIDKSPPKC